jgi:hypothetical protein
VIASHYAEPLKRTLAEQANLLAAPGDGSETVARLSTGDVHLMLDNSRGWAWGYAGPKRLVGYLRSEVLGKQLP